MEKPVIQPFPPAPELGDTVEVFDQKAFAVVQSLEPRRKEFNEVATYVNFKQTEIIDYTEAKVIEIQSFANDAEDAKAQTRFDAIRAGISANQSGAYATQSRQYRDQTKDLITLFGGELEMPQLQGQKGRVVTVNSDETGFIYRPPAVVVRLQELGIPATCPPHTAITVNLSATALLPGVTISKFVISFGEIETEVDAVDGKATFDYVTDHAEGEVVYYSIYAMDSEGNVSPFQQGMVGYTDAAQVIEIPAILTPEDGEAVLERPVVTATPFSLVTGFEDTHVESEWTFYSATGSVIRTIRSTTDLESLRTPANLLVEGGVGFSVAVRYRGAKYGWSERSPKRHFITRDAFTYIEVPHIVSPVNGATEIPAQPIIEFSEFTVFEGEDVYLGTKVRVKNSLGTIIHISDMIEEGQTYMLPSGILEQGEQNYLLSVEQYGEVLGASGWSEDITITTRLTFSLMDVELGAPVEGGFLGGFFGDNDFVYGLIVADAAMQTKAAWKTERTSTTSTDSLIDGITNTYFMTHSAALRALHPAAAICVDYRGGGKDDWYLPAKNELEILYRNLKPTTGNNNTSSGTNPNGWPQATGNYTANFPFQTFVENFQAGGSQAWDTSDNTWSSSQDSASNSWTQSFSSGLQLSYNYKDSLRVVRAVRRVVVQPLVPIGTYVPEEGGFLGGYFVQDGWLYALYVADAEMQTKAAWKTEQTVTFGTDDVIDGPLNTYNMTKTPDLKEQHPAAAICVDYRGGGKDDWYLPAKNELEILYRNLKPTTENNNKSSGTNPNGWPPSEAKYTAANPSQTTLALFQAGGSQAWDTSASPWSSSQDPASHAWSQYFTSGLQYSSGYEDSLRVVRAVRRVVVRYVGGPV